MIITHSEGTTLFKEISERKTDCTVSITHSEGTTLLSEETQREKVNVSITHSEGTTTVFSTLLLNIIHVFGPFSSFFTQKVGQPPFSKIAETVGNTGFLQFVKISKIHDRLFGPKSAFFACFLASKTDVTVEFQSLEVDRLFGAISEKSFIFLFVYTILSINIIPYISGRFEFSKASVISPIKSVIRNQADKQRHSFVFNRYFLKNNRKQLKASCLRAIDMV